MKKQLVYLIALLLLQTSCDRVFTMSGHVIDELGNSTKVNIIARTKLYTWYRYSTHYVSDLSGPVFGSGTCGNSQRIRRPILEFKTNCNSSQQCLYY